MDPKLQAARRRGGARGAGGRGPAPGLPRRPGRRSTPSASSSSSRSSPSASRRPAGARRTRRYVADLTRARAGPEARPPPTRTRARRSSRRPSGRGARRRPRRRAARRAVPLEPLKEGLRLGRLRHRRWTTRARRRPRGPRRAAPRSSPSPPWPGRARSMGKWTQPAKISDVMKPGRPGARARLKAPPAAGRWRPRWTRCPRCRAALVVIDPANRYVVAMVRRLRLRSARPSTAPPRPSGSRARRSSRSSTPPRSAARSFTPVSLVNDAPEAVRDPYTGKVVEAAELREGGFEGPMTLRQALTKSKNTVSVRLIEAITPAGRHRLRAPGGHPLRAAGEPDARAGHRRGDDAGARQRVRHARRRSGSTPTRHPARACTDAQGHGARGAPGGASRRRCPRRSRTSPPR